LALLEHGAHVTIVSSSQDKIDAVLKKVNNPNLQGKVGNARDEASYTELLKSLGPVDHVIYSGVDKIIRGAIADADFDECKYLFGVKFWGAALTGKSKLSLVRDVVGAVLISLLRSCLEIRHHKAGWIFDIDLWYWSDEAWNDCIHWRISQCWTFHHDARPCE
jgi:hypothetical protein